MNARGCRALVSTSPGSPGIASRLVGQFVAIRVAMEDRERSQNARARIGTRRQNWAHLPSKRTYLRPAATVKGHDDLIQQRHIEVFAEIEQCLATGVSRAVGRETEMSHIPPWLITGASKRYEEAPVSMLRIRSG